MTNPAATQQVAAILRASTLPVELQAFELTVFAREVGDLMPDGSPVVDPFRIEVGYGVYAGSLDAFPSWTDWPGKVIGQNLSSALGFLQITHTTFDTWSTLPDSTTDFNAPGQVVIGAAGAQYVYRRIRARDLLGDLKAGLLGEVQTALLPTWPGGMQKFAARYPAMLALLQQPPPAPPPPPDTVLFTGQDATGNPVEILLRRGSAAMTAALALGMLGLGILHAAPEASPTPLAPPSIEALQGYGAIWRFGQGELGALTIECRAPGLGQRGAIWQVCPR